MTLLTLAKINSFAALLDCVKSRPVTEDLEVLMNGASFQNKQ